MVQVRLTTLINSSFENLQAIRTPITQILNAVSVESTIGGETLKISRTMTDTFPAQTPEAWLVRISRSQNEPSADGTRAKEILAVAAGNNYTEGARLAGIESGDTVSRLVERFNEKECKRFNPDMADDLRYSIAP